MSTVTAPATTIERLRHRGVDVAISDALLIARRNLLRYLRIPTLIVFSTIQPIMFVLLFRYVFGNSIKLPPGISYVDYLMPGIFVQTVVFGSTATGIGLAEDLSKGIVDRFRSLPMARSAVLAGRTVADGVRNLFVVLLMFAVGMLVGFRLHNNVVLVVAGIVLALLFGYAFSWISAAIGLGIRDVESTQAASFVWLFPLTFASSAFAPVNNMPGWLQAWAKVNPVTKAVDALRGLFGVRDPATGMRYAAGRPVLETLVWIAVILVVFATLSIRSYRKNV